MIQMRIDLPTGEPKKLKALTKEAKARLAVGINRASLRLDNAIKLNLSKGGTVPRSTRAGGRVRIIPRNPGKHLRVITGFLRTSWRMIPAKVKGNIIEGHVATRAKYAAIHEFGGRTGRNHATLMPKRPYVAPALDKEKPAMIKEITASFLEPLK